MMKMFSLHSELDDLFVGNLWLCLRLRTLPGPISSVGLQFGFSIIMDMLESYQGGFVLLYNNLVSFPLG